MPDLWPKDITRDRPKSPVAILREQASLLAPKTQNMVEATVDTLAPFPDAEFRYAFIIIAPALGDYRYELFSIEHGITMYPVKFHLDDDTMREIEPGSNPRSPIVAESEEEYVKILGQTLGSKKTIQVVQTILAQSDA
jgi:hypothetical protein